jgi:hypothetical protein
MSSSSSSSTKRERDQALDEELTRKRRKGERYANDNGLGMYGNIQAFAQEPGIWDLVAAFLDVKPLVEVDTYLVRRRRDHNSTGEFNNPHWIPNADQAFARVIKVHPCNGGSWDEQTLTVQLCFSRVCTPANPGWMATYFGILGSEQAYYVPIHHPWLARPREPGQLRRVKNKNKSYLPLTRLLHVRKRPRPGLSEALEFDLEFTPCSGVLKDYHWETYDRYNVYVEGITNRRRFGLRFS